MKPAIGYRPDDLKEQAAFKATQLKGNT